MSHYLEFHLIQNFAPSNLNRDDNGSPKDAMFGGFRRARVSSQCFKRSVRNVANQMALLTPEHLGMRTKKIKQEIIARLPHRDKDEASGKVDAALSSADLKIKEDGTTEYLIFLGTNEINAIADLIDKNWDELSVGVDKKGKKELKAPSDLGTKIKSALDGGKAVDLALFGRMLANAPSTNIDAACQVAHAISTHKVERDFDYFTAVDDRGCADETGAGMIGQVEFNSSTFYRYAVLNLEKLASNLHGDHELVLAAVRAFTEAMARAIPSGKQNSFAAHNQPEFVGLCMRHAAPLSLANAFERPVAARRDCSLTAQSVAELAAYEAKVSAFYADARDDWLTMDLTSQWPAGRGESKSSLAELATSASAAVAKALGIAQ